MAVHEQTSAEEHVEVLERISKLEADVRKMQTDLNALKLKAEESHREREAMAKSLKLVMDDIAHIKQSLEGLKALPDVVTDLRKNRVWMQGLVMTLLGLIGTMLAKAS